MILSFILLAKRLLMTFVIVLLATLARSCPFCKDAPMRADGKRCIAICRNPQNVGDPEVHDRFIAASPL